MIFFQVNLGAPRAIFRGLDYSTMAFLTGVSTGNLMRCSFGNGLTPWCMLSCIIDLCRADLIWPSDVVNGISHRSPVIAIKKVSKVVLFTYHVSQLYRKTLEV